MITNAYNYNYLNFDYPLNACPNLVEFREIAKEVMITNAYNYLNFPPCPNVEFREIACPIILCPNLEFREIAKEVMITNAYNYLNFPPWPAQIWLNLKKLQKR